jgi:hypothetical protein
MRASLRRVAACLLPVAVGAAADEPGGGQPLALTASQEQAVGIRVEHPLALGSAPPIAAFGLVLDPAALVTDLGRVESTAAAAAAASADTARLERLYHDDERASLKAVQAAEAQSAEAGAQARAAALSFRLQWGPLAAWSAPERRSLVEALGAGRRVLLRASVPGYRAGSAIAARALVEVDGVNVAARVLGPLPRGDPQSQSASWLLELERAPEGLGPGARAAVQLETAAAAGLLVPAAALVYAEQGVFVYRRESVGRADTFHYTAAPVRPLARVGAAWLVGGLASTDQVVVQGAGVLWSLEGLGSFSAAEQEHD